MCLLPTGVANCQQDTVPYQININVHIKDLSTVYVTQHNMADFEQKIRSHPDYRGNQVKTRSLGWALTRYDWCPLERKFGKKGKDTHREKKT